MTKKCSKNELFNVDRQFLESCTSDFEGITKVEIEYSLIKFVMPLTLI